MEKAILKTLAYADIFDYPLKVYEIHKWLIGRKATLRQVESALVRLNQNRKLPSGRIKIKDQKGYYFLPRKDGLVGKRKRRQKQSAWYFKKALFLSHFLKLVPWIKLVGVSGGLAMENASKTDDIDLFIITSKNRLWISRILAVVLLSPTGQRRKVGENGRKIAGKLCINILLEEDNLGQTSKDIYVAHEVLQMRPLWYRNGIYQKYLEENSWAFRFLPNWVGSSSMSFPRKRESNKQNIYGSPIKSGMTDQLESLAAWFQLKIMRKPKGMERIEDGALYFHPNDLRPWVLSEYRQRIKKIISP